LLFEVIGDNLKQLKDDKEINEKYLKNFEKAINDDLNIDRKSTRLNSSHEQ
jgi:hypothetical protein